MKASVNSEVWGLEEAPQGFRQQVVEIVRTSLGNERARLRCQRCRQLGLDSDLFHLVKLPRPAGPCLSPTKQSIPWNVRLGGHARRSKHYIPARHWHATSSNNGTMHRLPERHRILAADGAEPRVRGDVLAYIARGDGRGAPVLGHHYIPLVTGRHPLGTRHGTGEPARRAVGRPRMPVNARSFAAVCIVHTWTARRSSSGSSGTGGSGTLRNTYRQGGWPWGK